MLLTSNAFVCNEVFSSYIFDNCASRQVYKKKAETCCAFWRIKDIACKTVVTGGQSVCLFTHHNGMSHATKIILLGAYEPGNEPLSLKRGISQKIRLQCAYFGFFNFSSIKNSSYLITVLCKLHVLL
jgi:hypothetical protein